MNSMADNNSSTEPTSNSGQQQNAPQPESAPVQPNTPVAPVQQAQTPPSVPAVSSDEKLWATVAYIPLVALVALIMKPASAFVRLHARQGLLLFGILFLALFINIIPFLGPALWILVQFGLVLLGLYSMFQSFSGNWWKIPVLGDIAEKIPVDVFTKAATQAINPQANAQDQQEEKTSENQNPPPQS
jgi:uncharacterized membrane protein